MPTVENAARAESASVPVASAPPRTTRGSRILIGCGFGCAGIALLFLVTLVAGVLWLVIPPDQFPSDAIVGPGTIAVVRIEDLAGDPGATQSLAALEEAARAMADEPGRHGGAVPFSKLTGFLPREVTLIVEPGSGTAAREGEDGGRGRPCLAINLRAFVRPLRLGLLSLDERAGWTRLERLGFPVRVSEEEGVALAFADGTLLIAEELGALEEALGRIAAWKAGDGSAPPLPEDYPQEQEGWDLCLWARGAPGELEAALTPWLARTLGAGGEGELGGGDLAGVLALTGGVDLVDAERVRWRTRVELVDELAAERLLVRIEEALERAAREAHERGQELTWRCFASERRVVTVEGEEVGLGSLWRDLVPR